MTNPPLNDLRVLIIDDEKFMRTTLFQVLTLLGIQSAKIYEASNAVEGIRETIRMRPSIVFCDIHMEGGDGFDYVQSLHQSPLPDVAATPVVMLTSDATESAVLTAKQLKIDGYVVKPMSVNAVKLVIERVFKVKLE